MTKWEYKIARENPDRGEEGEKWLNAFGADGWEMISHRLVHKFYNEYLFKRPLQERSTARIPEIHQWQPHDTPHMPKSVLPDDLVILKRMINDEEFGPVIASLVDWSFVALYCKYRVVKSGSFGWHELGDGVIPSPSEQVEVKRRNGTIETGKASIFRWNEWGNDFDIVAWRLNG